MAKTPARYHSDEVHDDRYSARYDTHNVGTSITRRLGTGLSELKAARAEALGKRRMRWLYTAIAVAAVIGGFAWAHVTYGWEMWIAAAVGLVVAVAGYIWASQATNPYERQLRSVVMEEVCASIGDVVYDEAALGFSIAPFASANLFSSFDDHETEQHLHGRYRGCTFSVARAHLESVSHNPSNNSSRRSTVFLGLLLSVSMPKSTRGRIMIFHDWGGFVNTLTATFNPGTQVPIPHEGFERNYEVYAEFPDEVPQFVNKAFADRFLKLRDLVDSKNIVGAFSGPQFLLAIHGVDGLVDDLNASLPLDELAAKADKVHEEVLVVHRIIDELHAA